LRIDDELSRVATDAGKRGDEGLGGGIEGKRHKGHFEHCVWRLLEWEKRKEERHTGSECVQGNEGAKMDPGKTLTDRDGEKLHGYEFCCKIQEIRWRKGKKGRV